MTAEPPKHGTQVRPLDRFERRGGVYMPSRQRTIVLFFDSRETAVEWDKLSDEQVGRLLADMTVKALRDGD